MSHIFCLLFYCICLLFKLLVCFDFFDQFFVFMNGFCVRHVIFYTSKQTNLLDEATSSCSFVVLAFLT